MDGRVVQRLPVGRTQAGQECEEDGDDQIFHTQDLVCNGYALCSAVYLQTMKIDTDRTAVFVSPSKVTRFFLHSWQNSFANSVL